MGRQANLWKKYKLEGGKLIKNVRYCPRCGRGFIMAEHNDRYTCGNCHYTEFKTSK